MGDFRKANRQYRRTAVSQRFTHADMDADGLNLVVDLPHGAIVTGGFVAVLTTFGASRTFDIGDREAADGTAGDADRYTPTALNATDLGVKEITADGVPYTGPNTVTLSLAAGDAPTTGEALVVIEYLAEDYGRDVHPIRNLPDILD